MNHLVNSSFFLSFLNSTEVYYFFTPVVPRAHRQWAPGHSCSSRLVLTKRAALGRAGWHRRWTQVPFSWLPSLFDHFLHAFQKAVSVLRVLKTLHVYVRILPLTSLSTTAPTACWATPQTPPALPWWHLWGAFLFEQCPFPGCLQGHSSVDSHGCGHRNNSMFSTRLREPVTYRESPLFRVVMVLARRAQWLFLERCIEVHEHQSPMLSVSQLSDRSKGGWTEDT